MQKHILTVTPSGSTGSATGSHTVTLTNPVELHGMYLDFSASATSDTCVRIEALSPAISVFTKVGSITDGWYFPREAFNTNTGAAYTGGVGVIRYPLFGTLALRVGSSSPVANAVTAYVFVEDI